MRLLVILLCVMRGELLMGEMVLHSGAEGERRGSALVGVVWLHGAAPEMEGEDGEWKSIQIQSSPDRP